MNGSSNNEVAKTQDLYEKSEKIHPRQVTGVFARLRVLSVWLLLGFYYLAPWIQWNGKQAILFDLPARKFYLFGVTLWPQDFFLLTLLLIVAALALFFFTSLAGRLWCGFACPQTVWTESFIWIEKWIEGDRNKRIKLDQSPWTPRKIFLKSFKHMVWLVFSLFTGITFVGYFSQIDQLFHSFFVFELGSWELFWVCLYSFATYGNAGWLREQVCLYMCPYARFQSAMFDKDTLIISYDAARGEPRGHRKRTEKSKSSSAELKNLEQNRIEQGSREQESSEHQKMGDCIDCYQCVNVCPTGIDIRDGLQYECIACAGCIDVCDDVMDKMGYPKGLIRYTTEHELEGNKTKVFRPRTIIYGTILTGLIILLLSALFFRTPLELDILRDRGRLYTETYEGLVENIYTLKILNKDQIPHDYQIEVTGIKDLKVLGELNVVLRAGEIKTLPIRVQVDPVWLKRSTTDINFSVQSASKPNMKVMEVNRFIGPAMGR